MADRFGVERGLARLSWWAAAVLGLACVALGVVITTRPFTSLSVLVVLVSVAMMVTGIATPASDRRATAPWATWTAGIAWIVAGVVALAWPSITTRGLALVAGIGLVFGGILEITGVRGSKDERVASLIGGSASVIFGVLALGWPDVTVLVIAVVFGIRTVLFGARLAFSAVRYRGASHQAVSDESKHRLDAFRRFMHVTVAVVALVAALGLGSVSAKIHEGVPGVDAFYDPPADVPSQPGVLLRSEPFNRGIPANATAWRILYTTTRDQDVQAVASAIVVAPSAASASPPPVIAWAHGTTGVARQCAPSIMNASLSAGALFVPDQIVDQGWVLVATDYTGLGTPGPHPYLIGQGEARSVLDAVRAAKQLPDLKLADQTIVWGHSQGGNAALWTGAIAPTYAPDVHVQGVVALAPASDLLGLLSNLGNVTGGSLFANYVVRAYSDIYPDVTLHDYVRPTAQVTSDQLASRCLDESALVSVLSAVTTSMSMFSTDLASGALKTRVEQNAPSGPIEAPLFIGQGDADRLVLPTVQAAYVQRLCASGQPLEYRTYPGRDHVPLVEPDSPAITDVIKWTQDRLNGVPPTPHCPNP